MIHINDDDDLKTKPIEMQVKFILYNCNIQAGKTEAHKILE